MLIIEEQVKMAQLAYLICRCFLIFSEICQLRLDFDNFDIVETTTGCVISTPFPFLTYLPFNLLSLLLAKNIAD